MKGVMFNSLAWKAVAILKDVILDDAGCSYGLTVIDNTFV